MKPVVFQHITFSKMLFLRLESAISAFQNDYFTDLSWPSTSVSSLFSIRKSYAGDRRSRNLYQKLARVSVDLVQLFFLYKFLPRNWAQQLYSRAETVRHVTRTVQCDWLTSCCCARNCDAFHCVKFSMHFLVHVSCTIFWYKFLERVSLVFI